MAAVAKANEVELELDRLTYSAYLLTLDPGVALSVAISVLDAYPEEERFDADLLGRTVELALQQVRLYSDRPSDRESSSFEVILQCESGMVSTACSLLLNQDIAENPILVLDFEPRVAFVLHHVLGYGTRKAAAMTGMSEKEYRKQLRKSYLQLAAGRTVSELPPLDALLESATA